MKSLDEEINDISKNSISSSKLSNYHIVNNENKKIISYLIYINNTNKERKEIEKIIKNTNKKNIDENFFIIDIFKTLILNIIKLNNSEKPSIILNNILYNLSGNVFDNFELNSSSSVIGLLNYYISIYFVKLKLNQDYSNLIYLFNSLQLLNQEDEESFSLKNSIISNSTNCNSNIFKKNNSKNKKPKIINELIEISKNEHLKNIKILKIILPNKSINKLNFYNYIFFYLNSIWLFKLIEELEINFSNFYYFQLSNNNNNIKIKKENLIYLLILNIFYYLNYLLSNFKQLKRIKLIIPFSFNKEISKSFCSDLYIIQCLLNNKKYETKSVSTNSCFEIDIFDILNLSFKNYNKNFYIEFNSLDSELFKKVNEIIKNNNFENLTIVFFPLNNQENIYENYNIENENIFNDFEKNLSDLLNIFNELEIIYYICLQFEIPLKFINSSNNKINYNKCINLFINNIKISSKFSNIKFEILSKTLNINLNNK